MKEKDVKEGVKVKVYRDTDEKGKVVGKGIEAEVKRKPFEHPEGSGIMCTTVIGVPGIHPIARLRKAK